MDGCEHLEVEARLRLNGEGVIAGTVSGGDRDPRSFHGWLELMDAIEAIRHDRTRSLA